MYDSGALRAEGPRQRTVVLESSAHEQLATRGANTEHNLLRLVKTPRPNYPRTPRAHRFFLGSEKRTRPQKRAVPQILPGICEQYGLTNVRNRRAAVQTGEPTDLKQ